VRQQRSPLFRPARAGDQDAVGSRGQHKRGAIRPNSNGQWQKQCLCTCRTGYPMPPCRAYQRSAMVSSASRQAYALAVSARRPIAVSSSRILGRIRQFLSARACKRCFDQVHHPAQSTRPFSNLRARKGIKAQLQQTEASAAPASGAARPAAASRSDPWRRLISTDQYRTAPHRLPDC